MGDHSVYVGQQAPVRQGGDLSSLPPGTVLAGHYEIIAHLGTGGFGIVYEAHDLQAGRQVVAIKEYFPAANCLRRGSLGVSGRGKGDADAFAQGLRAFLDEAKLLRELEHPGIVRIFHWFEANGTAYIVMKRLRGRTLQELVEEGARIPEEQVRAWLGALLEALGEVHAHGVLHRDITPRNIVITAQGVPVLIDFGAARQSVGRVSQTLASIASPGYAPLEQYDEHGLNEQGPSTDLYALGATFYHLCVGARPMASTNRVLKDRLRPAVEAAGDGYGAPLLATIDRALAVRAQARWSSTAQWREALRAIAGPADSAADRRGAGVGIRLAAHFLDSLAYLPVAIVLVLLASGDEQAHAVASFVVPAVLTVGFWIVRQATPGKMAMNLRIVDANSGGAIEPWQAVLRFLGYLVAALPFGLGLAWIAVDRRRRGWHDHLAGTVVVQEGAHR